MHILLNQFSMYRKASTKFNIHNTYYICIRFKLAWNSASLLLYFLLFVELKLTALKRGKIIIITVWISIQIQIPFTRFPSLSQFRNLMLTTNSHVKYWELWRSFVYWNSLAGFWTSPSGNLLLGSGWTIGISGT